MYLIELGKTTYEIAQELPYTNEFWLNWNLVAPLRKTLSVPLNPGGPPTFQRLASAYHHSSGLLAART